jgi:hypothetical protein
VYIVISNFVECEGEGGGEERDKLLIGEMHSKISKYQRWPLQMELSVIEDLRVISIEKKIIKTST